MSSRPIPCIIAALIAAAALPSPARADIIDLTTAGSSGSAGGTLFYQADPQPTGTGVIQPFVRIQRTGTERGYNTDARPVEFDTKDQNQWTHSLPLNTLTPVEINGTQYYQFLLDINEQGNARGSLLSLNDVQIYLGNAPDLTGFTSGSGFGSNSVPVYNLDSTEDNTVELNYKLNHGSGSGDMFMYVPVSYFQGFGGQYQYVYLYSAFGTPHASDAGFEEWAALTGGKGSTGGGNPVPAPPGLVLAGVGFGCMFIGRLRLRRKV